MLRAAGWVLVANEPVELADIIVVAVEADGAGMLEIEQSPRTVAGTGTEGQGLPAW
jgi:hypothetical protein